MVESAICTYLRGKNGLGNLEGGENPWHMFDRVTTSFTCLCTGEPFGPDDGLADANSCTGSRGCYSQQQEEPEERQEGQEP